MPTGSPVPSTVEERSNVSTDSRLVPEKTSGRLTDVHGTSPVKVAPPPVDEYWGSHALTGVLAIRAFVSG